MAEDTPHEAPRGTTNGSKGGKPKQAGAPQGGRGPDNAWKWLTGAIAAAAVLGGGYYVWKNMDANPSGTDYASTEAPLTAGALPADASGDATMAAGANAGAPAPQGTQAASRATASAPEEVVGVRHAGATARGTSGASSGTNANDELVVRGRRSVWTRKPSARRLSAMYPQMALERGREGEASLRCRVDHEGELDCVRVSESSAGFGRAAMRVARSLRHGPRLADGSQAYGSSIRLRVVFRIADEERRRG
ncbi:MAG: TonB family protein [Hyphomonadaceae bacterium]|nr:TonB family protein [Hyphomonadaceae bacterium]